MSSLELRVQFCLLVCCTYPSSSTVNKEKNLIDQRASLRVDTRETQQFQTPHRGARCFLAGIAFSFPMGCRPGLNVWYRSLAFGGCVQSMFSVFGGFHLLLVVARCVSRVVADGLRPSDSKDSSKAGVDTCLGPLRCRSSCLSFCLGVSVSTSQCVCHSLYLSGCVSV